MNLHALTGNPELLTVLGALGIALIVFALARLMRPLRVVAATMRLSRRADSGCACCAADDVHGMVAAGRTPPVVSGFSSLVHE